MGSSSGSSFSPPHPKNVLSSLSSSTCVSLPEKQS